METSFIPLFAIIAVLIIAFLLASLPQVNHKTRYRVLYAIAIIMLLAVIPISEYMAGGIQNSSNNYLLVLIFDIAVGYFCMYIAALLKFNVLKRSAFTARLVTMIPLLLPRSTTRSPSFNAPAYGRSTRSPPIKPTGIRPALRNNFDAFLPISVLG